MNIPINHLVLAVVFSFFTISCTTLPQSGRSSDHQTIGVYSRNIDYALTAGLTTAVTATIAKCAYNLINNDSCINKKELGSTLIVAGTSFALGASGGWIVASRQKTYQSEALKQKYTLDLARQELGEARASREAASRIAASHTATVTGLRNEKLLGTSEKQKLSNELKLIKKDITLFESAKDRLEIEIDGLQKEIDITRNQSTSNEYVQLRDDLKKERNEMQKLIDTLNGLLQ